MLSLLPILIVEYVFRIEGEEWGTWVDEDALFGESNNYVRKTLELSDKIVDKATKDLNNVIEAGNKLNTVKKNLQ